MKKSVTEEFCRIVNHVICYGTALQSPRSCREVTGRVVGPAGKLLDVSSGQTITDKASLIRRSRYQRRLLYAGQKSSADESCGRSIECQPPPCYPPDQCTYSH